MVPSILAGIVPGPVEFCLNISRALARHIRRLAGADSGSIVPMAATILPIILVASGGAMDVSRAYSAHARARSALDAAVLSGAQSLLVDRLATNESIGEKVRKVAIANLSDNSYKWELDSRIDKTAVNATIRISVDTPFLSVIRIPELVFTIEAGVELADLNLEIALVLDTTGSIRENGHVASITSAVSDLIADLEPVAPKFALVPFSETVNLGNHTKADWIDVDGNSPTHGIMFDESRGPIVHGNLFSSMGLAWNNCVEMRARPYDVTDDPPGADPATKWVPFFGPSVNPYGNYLNSGYTNVRGVGVVMNTTYYRASNLAAVADPGHPGDNYDPVSNCNRSPIVPLTTDMNRIRNALQDLDFDGGTNIPSGLAWGWRVLSPGEPFTEGGPYKDPNTRKVLVLLSDGKNDMKVEYNGYGMFYDKRLGQSGRFWQEMDALVNARMDLLCSNIKDAGIKLYVVSYALANDAETRAHKQRMANCASAPDLHFDTQSSADLRDALADIVRRETPLHLSR